MFRERVHRLTVYTLFEDTSLESLTLVDENGTRWMFEARGRQVEGFTPSHVREHMVLGQPVRVTFHRENGALIINDITD